MAMKTCTLLQASPLHLIKISIKTLFIVFFLTVSMAETEYNSSYSLIAAVLSIPRLIYSIAHDLHNST